MLSLFKRRARRFGLCLLILLSGCGGGDGSGKPLVGGGASSQASVVPAAIDVVAANTTVGTGGDGVLIRAFVKDANNNALPATSVAFRASTGTLSSVSAKTDTSGLASATLSAGADRSNRPVTVTLSAGAVNRQITLPIAGTALTLQGPSAIVLGSSAAFDVMATDSKGNVIAGLAITATSTLGQLLTVAPGDVTGANGLVRFSYTASKGGVDPLSFSAGGAVVSTELSVSALNFGFISPVAATTVPVNAAQLMSVKLLVDGSVPGPTVINFAATGGILSSPTATTDAASGLAQVSITSASAGPLTVQASVQVGGSVTSTSLPLYVVGTVPGSLVLQVNPTALAPNVGASTAHQAQVLARLTDAAGNPVQGLTLNFTRVADPSGGNLQQVSAITDPSGKASVTYVSGPQSSANDGVVLQALVEGSAPAISGRASLTVNQAALFIALGTGNVVANVDPQTYRKDWVAYVTDSNGIAVNAATLSFKAIPTHYRTGRLAYDALVKAHVYVWPIYECRNEDANTNGSLESGEDDNGDGVLWPGNVIAVSPGNSQTSNGLTTIALTYAESYVPWVRLRLTVSATVAGTESRTNAEFVVPGDAGDFTDQAKPPAGLVSPYGLLPNAAALATPGACALLAAP